MKHIFLKTKYERSTEPLKRRHPMPLLIKVF
ncbi:hypothetical protein ANCCAN_18191 [Ancylostoma caninum]|uniref:Uncharacterized protein n=1 Tax=Ancylostoma caninum TaxID=29170 RepID=A0A368FWR3_ANCCA|nr:hypothetical protein ANCCAN_18191 [Ancylostoma caninum]